MTRRAASSPFQATDPLGLPRPVDPANIFGARLAYFVRNRMPVPTGCLAHFDRATYRPYLTRIVGILAYQGAGWGGPVILPDPPRYALIRAGVPAEIPEDLIALLPQPPRVSLHDLLEHFSREYSKSRPPQLLDVLSLIREDMGAIKFAFASAEHAWVAEAMR